MHYALENNLFALSLFHLCSCILCSILLQWKVTEQISLTIETVIVCPLQQFPPAQKKSLAQGRLLRCGAFNCSFHAPSPSGLSRVRLKQPVWKLQRGNERTRTVSNFQPLLQAAHGNLGRSAQTPFLQQSFQISNSVWQSLSTLSCCEHTQRSEQT